MSDHTHIEWTDATWNPITGCGVVSAGCKHCYAMRLAGTRLRDHPSRAGLTRETSAGPVWTGKVRLNEAWLDQPLRWKKPRRIFVCAHGDLFHEAVPDEWIDRVFAVMALASQHTYQILTKRTERMREYLSQSTAIGRIFGQYVRMGRVAHILDDPSVSALFPWPLPNVWLGTSVENQVTADERIPLLLDTPAAVRWISAEPLIGKIDLESWLGYGWCDECNSQPAALSRWPLQDGLRRCPCGSLAVRESKSLVDWIVAGGESGPGARPPHPDWFRSLRDQCQAAGVAFFFKQWGEWLPMMGHAEGVPVRREKFFHPDGTIMGRAGKRAAGRLLDGREWNQYPEARP